MTRRTERLNSLLREVISEVIQKQVRNPHIPLQLVSITRVDITTDLHYAKVFVSVIGDDALRVNVIKALGTASGFIALNASKLVRMRYFPSLTFKLDTSVDSQLRIDELLSDIEEEKKSRD
ncbi:MAG: 30S ribosome-binding factor RbfA [Simkaniaceae bacterium]